MVVIYVSFFHWMIIPQSSPPPPPPPPQPRWWKFSICDLEVWVPLLTDFILIYKIIIVHHHGCQPYTRTPIILGWYCREVAVDSLFGSNHPINKHLKKGSKLNGLVFMAISMLFPWFAHRIIPPPPAHGSISMWMEVVMAYSSTTYCQQNLLLSCSMTFKLLFSQLLSVGVFVIVEVVVVVVVVAVVFFFFFFFLV